MSVRDDAVEAIKNGGMVVVNREVYTLTKTENSKGLDELPPLEDFVVGDANAEAEALKQLKKDKAELEKRLESLTNKVSSNKEEKKAAKDETDGK